MRRKRGGRIIAPWEQICSCKAKFGNLALHGDFFRVARLKLRELGMPELQRFLSLGPVGIASSCKTRLRIQELCNGNGGVSEEANLLRADLLRRLEDEGENDANVP